MQTSVQDRRSATRAAQRHAPSDPSRGKPAWWPFGPLTESQIRARIRFEARMRAGRLAALPEALP